MRKQRCIDPLVALIVLIGVTIAIAVAFAGWAVNLWNTQSRVLEAIRVTGHVYTPENRTLKLRLVVHMKPKAEIYKVDIVGVEVGSTGVNYWVDKVEVGNVIQDDGRITAPVGSKFWIGISLPGTKPVPPGTAVEVRIYTESGYLYRTTIIL